MKNSDNAMKIAVKTIISIGLILYLLYGLKLIARIFLFDSFIIPSESMMPTLKPGDRVYVNKVIYGARIYTDFHFTKDGQELKAFRTRGLRDIKHNDIVVFNMPNQNEKIKFTINYVYCKRCLGLPGDTIKIKNGYYECNNFKDTLGYLPAQRQLQDLPDSVIPQMVIRTMPYDEHLPVWTIKDFGPMYIPRKGDLIKITTKEAAMYKILLEYELKQPVDIDWKLNEVFVSGRRLTKYRFKHNYYFMAGDNVINSRDSRYWGLVPDEYIVGVVKGKWGKEKFVNL